MSTKRNALTILILGALCTVSPFSIDMYLPAFPQMAHDLGTSVGRIALSLSSYFIGMAVGQLFYGPLLDRYGRKKPLYFGLALYILASLACVSAGSVETIIALRALQALGGCAAMVASMAMVRDFFPVEEGAKVFSLLMLILGVSPLLAPTVGGFAATAFGWHGVFVLLAGIVFAIFGLSFFFLPNGRAPDSTVSLRIVPILEGYWEILRHPHFSTYALAGAFSFGGLFVYVAGSPIIFMDLFGVSAKTYGAIFAILSVGFIGGSQVNIWLARKFPLHRIFQTALIAQAIVAFIFLVGALTGGYSLIPTTLLFFAFLSCVGITNPNAAALALAPFETNAGRASALLGFLQIGMGALASAGVGFFDARNMLPSVSILAVTSWIGLAIFWSGRNKVKSLSVPSSNEVRFVAH